MNETYTYPSGEIPPEVLGAYLVIGGISLLVGIAVAIVLCILFKKNYEAIPAEHRQQFEPSQVWLLLIPLFNLYWTFVVVLRLSASYKSFFDAQGVTTVGDCGRGIGMAYAICTVCSIIPCLNYATGPAALILLIIYLVKVFDLRSKVLQAGNAPVAEA